MGLFDLVRGKEFNREIASAQSIRWEDLHSIRQLEEIVKTSYSKPVIIFKHSTRCSASSMVLRELEREYSVPEDKMKAYFLDLISHRVLSDEVAKRFQITHQSPQILVVSKGEVVHHASHYAIDAKNLIDFIDLNKSSFGSFC